MTYKLNGLDNQVLLIEGDAISVLNPDSRQWPDYQDWLSAGNTPDPVDSPTTEQVLGDIASKRYDQEVAGITYDGLAFYSDRATQMKILAVYLQVSKDSSYTVNWKLSDGTFTVMDATKIIAVAGAINDYVQACYDRESVLVSAVNAGTYTSDQLDTGWPSQTITSS